MWEKIVATNTFHTSMKTAEINKWTWEFLIFQSRLQQICDWQKGNDESNVIKWYHNIFTSHLEIVSNFSLRWVEIGIHCAHHKINKIYVFIYVLFFTDIWRPRYILKIKLKSSQTKWILSALGINILFRFLILTALIDVLGNNEFACLLFLRFTWGPLNWTGLSVRYRSNHSLWFFTTLFAIVSSRSRLQAMLCIFYSKASQGEASLNASWLNRIRDNLCMTL